MPSPDVIKEGGLGGHINHLYENPNLSFGEIKEIFQLAASGELEGTQKIDGQNIFLSYSLKRGMPVAARNKTNIKAGGMSADELAKKFEGRDSIQKAFVDAFDAFRQAVSSFSPEEIKEIFGEDGEIYYSAEVIDPGAANVIDYDEKVLNIHRTGHGRVDRETGGAVADYKDPDIQKSSAALDAAISKVENTLQGSNFKVQRSEVQKLQSIVDGAHVQRAINQLDSIVGGDAETVGEFLIKKLKPLIQKKMSLPKDKQNMLIQKMLGAKGINKREIKKGLSPEEQAGVDEFISQSGGILKSVIRPIEMVVHEFSVAALEGMESLYMLGAQGKKVQGIRDKVASEIDAIKAGGSEADIAKLQQQLEKMKYAEKGLKGITTASEGFVFDFDGTTYKFTGNYAPINQILGIIRYKRSGKQSMNERSGLGIALLPGGFKPPHAGHYELAKWAGEQPGVDRAIVLVSPKARGPVTVEQSMQIWELYKNTVGGNFDVQKSGVNSPVGASYEYLDNVAMPGQTIFVIKGEKDAADKRFKGMQGRKEGVEVKELISPTFAGGVSGTIMREYITSGNVQGFQDALPKGLSQEDKNKAWGIVSEGTNLEEYLRKVVEEVLEENAFTMIGKALQPSLVKIAEPRVSSIATKARRSTGKFEEDMENFPDSAPYTGGITLTKEEDDEIEKIVNEITTMASGAVEGGGGSAWTNFKEEENDEERKKAHRV